MLAVSLFLVALLGVTESPVGVGTMSVWLATFIFGPLAWQLSVAVTEWGHIPALIALLVFLPGWKRSIMGRISAVFAAAAIVLALSTFVRAISVARTLPEKLANAFGAAEPRAGLGAAPRPAPVVAADFFRGVPSPKVQIAALTYVVRDTTQLQLDLYRPLHPTARVLPIALIIHGGSWAGGSRRDLSPLNRYLAARGYAVAAMSYRFAPEYPHPAASEDVHAAIHFLEGNARKLGVDASRIALIGRSAGAQLALLAAYTERDPAIRGVIGFYPPTDQLFGYEHPSNTRIFSSSSVLRVFLGGTPQTVPVAYQSSSPINFVGPSTVPTLLIHGANDELVWIRQSERLDSALTAAHRPRFLLRLPWATHGCDFNFNGPCGQISTYAVERFLANILR